ncbi:MAG: alpha/beta hydrolase [Candidatus Omnitrophica bacterium]|nr:alpha/beta hydrolase [Candidatus Omnitrophota bacterium]
MLRILIYIGLLIVFALGYTKYLESRCIYFPMKGIEITPSHAGLLFEDLYLETKDGLKINGWFIPQDQAKYTLLFCHGNGGNIEHRIEKLLKLRKYGLNIFIFDYRGYGRSQGKPSETGLYHDTQAAYDYLVTNRQIKPEQIILYGESLGCAAAVHLASQQKTGGLILEGSFSRGRDMAKKIYPFLPAFLFSNSFNSQRRIGKITAPKLFLHSKHDEIVPFVLAKQLYDVAPEPKEFVELIGGHNTTYFDDQEKYLSGIASFVERLP